MPLATLTFPVALVVTIVVELPAWVVLLRALSDVEVRTAAAIGVGVNLVTHPLFWFVLLPALEAVLAAWLAFAVSEAVVVVAETAMAVAGTRASPRPAPVRLVAAVALAANLLSMGAGFLLNRQ